MVDIHDKDFNLKLAEALKKLGELKKPEFMDYVKSSPSKERPPVDEDFWFKRAASILRQIYIRKIVGVNRLRTRYGSKKNRGKKPERFMKSGGKIIRLILQQAEKAGLVEKISTKKKGRSLTKHGRKLIEELK